MRLMIGRWTLSGCHAVAARRRVGCSAFLLFQRDECHSAFRTISWLIGYDFGMHRAGVLLRVSLLMLLLDLVRMMRMLCEQCITGRECNKAGD